MPQSFNLEGTPLELLDVGELALIHSNYRPMDTWLLDKLFPNRPLFTRDDVPLAEVSAEHDLAPLVSPQQPGKPFDNRLTTSQKIRSLRLKLLKLPCLSVYVPQASSLLVTSDYLSKSK